MWGLVSSMVGKVVSVVTRFVLNRLLRRYLKLREVRVYVYEGRIEVFEVVLDLAALRQALGTPSGAFKQEGCTLSTVEVTAPRLSRLFRNKSAGCRVNVKGARFVATLEDTAKEDIPNDNNSDTDVSEEESAVSQEESEEEEEEESDEVSSPATTTTTKKEDPPLDPGAKKKDVVLNGGLSGLAAFGVSLLERLAPNSEATVSDVDLRLESSFEETTCVCGWAKGTMQADGRGSVAFRQLRLSVGTRILLEVDEGFARLQAPREVAFSLKTPRCVFDVSENAKTKADGGFFDASSQLGDSFAARLTVDGIARVELIIGDHQEFVVLASSARLDATATTIDVSASGLELGGAFNGDAKGLKMGCTFEKTVNSKMNKTTAHLKLESCDARVFRTNSAKFRDLSLEGEVYGDEVLIEAEAQSALLSVADGAATVEVRKDSGACKLVVLEDNADAELAMVSLTVDATKTDLIAETIDELLLFLRSCSPPPRQEASSSSEAQEDTSSSSSSMERPIRATVGVVEATVTTTNTTYVGSLGEVEYVFDGFVDAAKALRFSVVAETLGFEAFGEPPARGSTTARVASDDENDAVGADRDRPFAIDLSRRRGDAGAALAAAVRRASIKWQPSPSAEEEEILEEQVLEEVAAKTFFEEIAGLSRLRLYVALYDCDLEYATIPARARLAVGFARFAATLSDEAAVCSTRVRDLELDLCVRRRRARMATLDVLDAVAKHGRGRANVDIDLGTLRTYACHDSLASLLDLANHFLTSLGVTYDDDDVNKAVTAVLDLDDIKTATKTSTSPGVDEVFFDENSENSFRKKKTSSSSLKSFVESNEGPIEDYVPTETNKNSPLKTTDIELRATSLRLVDSRDDDDALIGDERPSSRLLREDHFLDDDDGAEEESLPSEISDDDFAEPTAAWYGADTFDSDQLKTDHVQPPLPTTEEDNFFDPDDDADRFRFDLKSTAVACRFFTGSEWSDHDSDDDDLGQDDDSVKQRRHKKKTTLKGKSSNKLLSDLLESGDLKKDDDDEIVEEEDDDDDDAGLFAQASSSSSTKKKTRKRHRGRNVEQLCEVTADESRLRFARPRDAEVSQAFRLELTVRDLMVAESVSSADRAMRPAVQHWTSKRHPRQTGDPMICLRARGIEDRRQTATRVRLALLPLRCRLDADFVGFVDAFLGTLDGPNGRDLVSNYLDSDDEQDILGEILEEAADDERLHDDDDDLLSSTGCDEEKKNEQSDAVWVEDVWSQSAASNTTKKMVLKKKSSTKKLVNDQEEDETMVLPSSSSFKAENHSASLEVSAWKLKLDYRPRGVDGIALRRGSLSELLYLFALERVELDLRRCEATAPNLALALDRVRAKWASELRDEQIHRFVAGAEPLRPLAAVSASAVDIFAAPLAETLKGGRPLRALGDSAMALGEVTALEAARASRKVASGIANALDRRLQPSHRILRFNADGTPAYVSTKERWDVLHSDGDRRPPRDAREGLERARDAFLHSVSASSQQFAHIAKRPSTATLAAALPVALLQPVVGATRGIAWILLGIETAMDNDDDESPLFGRRTTRRRHHKQPRPPQAS